MISSFVKRHIRNRWHVAVLAPGSRRIGGSGMEMMRGGIVLRVVMTPGAHLADRFGLESVLLVGWNSSYKGVMTIDARAALSVEFALQKRRVFKVLFFNLTVWIKSV